jgi:23S rRNA (pseudouridine1915-N3)-methyltransferase
MKITLLCVAKTDNKNLETLVKDYCGRINKYIKFEIEYIIPPKNISKLQAVEIRKAECELILKKVEKADLLILLDEKGVSYSSVKFAAQIQKYMNAGFKHVYFVVGGAYGFSEEIYSKANNKLSMSAMTTTHQLIRLFFTEQVYRAFSILNGHPYHNE